MRISTKGQYAIRMMLDIATNYSGDPVRLKDIARRQDISDKYLEQIISILNKAGFVRSVRGPMGGYSLAKEPSEYTVGMILRLTEGSLAPVDYENSSAEQESVTNILWKKMSDAIDSVVDNITLEDLLNWQEAQTNDYVI
ncbi:MAG: Rrf2 family transcriptional regulator [Eubacteriales bacterium]|nr:Rrf2 family transcriptional regulator [Eubacteriales bacterium]